MENDITKLFPIFKHYFIFKNFKIGSKGFRTKYFFFMVSLVSKFFDLA